MAKEQTISSDVASLTQTKLQLEQQLLALQGTNSDQQQRLNVLDAHNEDLKKR